MEALHHWNLEPDEAVRLQEDLRKKVILSWDDREVRTIAGVAVHDAGEAAFAAIALFDYPGLLPLESVLQPARLHFPYTPGLLAFRIAPVILAAWAKLRQKPELLLVHGHGVAHPHGFGLASHLGLWLDVACIGVAKRRLYGIHAAVGSQVGEWSPLLDEQDRERVLGAALRTRLDARPMNVSPGHLIDLQHAVEFVLACCRDHSFPEPLRVARCMARGAHTGS